MKHYQKAAVLLGLAEALKTRGSWCGETHLQKATFFLQKLLGVDMKYDFILYKHGPYSFDLKEDLSAFLADDVFTYEIKHANYGPSIVPGRRSRLVEKQYSKTSQQFARQIEYIAQTFGDKNVKELEKLATALFVTLDNTEEHDARKRAAKLHEYKPHVDLEEALKAVSEVDMICEKSDGMCVV